VENKKSQAYYRLTQNTEDKYVALTKIRLPQNVDGSESTFILGDKINVPVPNPLEIDLDNLNGGSPRHYIEGFSIVIISELFLAALKKAEVDNFQVFPVALRDKKDGREWRNYYAFNEIGAIDVVSIEDCEYDVLDDEDGDIPALSFDRVVLSAKKLKTSNQKIFRLAQDPSHCIYISGEVVEILLEMTPPEKWGISCTKIEIK
jgi:hypothetical protein